MLLRRQIGVKVEVNDKMYFFNHHAGFDYLKKLISSKYRISMVSLLNNGRHLLVQCFKDRADSELKEYFYFYCLFKHNTFHSFNNEFESFVNVHPEFKGHGESINVEFLEYARRRDATLLYVYENGDVYQVESNLIYNFCYKFNLIRFQDRLNEKKSVYSNGVKEVVREKECVFPISLFQRF